MAKRVEKGPAAVAFRWRLMKGRGSAFTISTDAFFCPKVCVGLFLVNDIHTQVPSCLHGSTMRWWRSPHDTSAWVDHDTNFLTTVSFVRSLQSCWPWLQWVQGQNFHNICRQAACVCYLPDSVFFLDSSCIIYVYIFIHIYIYTRNAWGLPRGNINYQRFGIINYQGVNYHQLSGCQLSSTIRV